MQPVGNSTAASAFLPELQSLRGLAALTVLLHHCLFYYRYDEGLKFAAEVALNAHAAVVLFYVLSGFVLHGAIQRTNLTRSGVIQFYVRRLFRIYPALWIACLLALAYVLIFAGQPFAANVSDWFPAEFRSTTASPVKLGLAFAAASKALPVPLWSITIELVGSALLPLLVLASRRPPLFAAVFVVLLAWSFMGGMDTPMAVGGYLVDFAIGVAVAVWGVPLCRRLLSQRTALWLALAALAALVLVRQAGGWNYATHYHDPMAALLEVLSAAVMIAAIVAHPVRFGALRKRPVIRLGDISYSLYVLHLPILAFAAAILGEMFGLPLLGTGAGIGAAFALCAITLPVSLLLAELSYRWIELPGIALGKRFIASTMR